MQEQEELVCKRCAEVERENQNLRHALQSMSDENTATADELTGARSTLRTLEGQVRKLKAELSKTRGEAPRAETIKTILKHWRNATGNRGAIGFDEETGEMDVSVAAGSDRWKLVAKSLNRWKPMDLIEAIDGAALCPFMRYGKRYPLGKRSELRTDLEDCIGKDKWIEMNRDIVRRSSTAAKTGVQVLLDTYWRVNALEKAWARLAMDAVAVVEAGLEPGEPLEDFVRRRRQQIAQEAAA